jgi:hypothetical protein
MLSEVRADAVGHRLGPGLRERRPGNQAWHHSRGRPTGEPAQQLSSCAPHR